MSMMFANTIIAACWISATVFLVYTGHDYWAIATFLAALLDYFYLKEKKAGGA